MSQFFSSGENGQRNLRVVLFIIILATLPFYCLGFILWGAAPSNPGARDIATSTPTLPPLTRTVTRQPSPTSGFGPLVTVTSLSPLQPTPRQFLPPGGVNPGAPLPPTRYLSPTPFIIDIPTATPAPTLTPVPTETPIPQDTATTVPVFPTDTTVPFENEGSEGEENGDGGGSQENFINPDLEAPDDSENDIPEDSDLFETPTQEVTEE